jgi:hypothetical protein
MKVRDLMTSDVKTCRRLTRIWSKRSEGSESTRRRDTC